MVQHAIVRVLIAVAYEDLHDMVRLHLDQARGLLVVGDVRTLDAAAESIRTLKPDVILMEDRFPPVDSAHAARTFQKLGLHAPILVISTTVEYYLIFRCFLYGVRGFMHRDEVGEMLVDAVHKIDQGSLYFSPKVRSVYGKS